MGAAPPRLRQPQRPEPGSHAIAAAEAFGVAGRRLRSSKPCSGWASRSSGRWSSRGHRVRVYTPYGAILPGMAYLVRRLLENTSNESFLKASFAGGAEVDQLLARSRGGRCHVDPKANATSPPVPRPRSRRSPTSP